MANLVSTAASSRSRIAAYWVTTVLVASELGVGGAWDILRIPYVRAIIEHLGYPSYFLVILGVWKVLGAMALLVPRFPRLKEWAYAGAIFTYTGATGSHLTVGDDARAVMAPIIFTGLTAASWALRPSSRRAHVHRIAEPSAPVRRSLTVAFWVSTLVLATECVVGGVMGALQLPPFIGVIAHLGYPAYFMTILGIWYVLAGLALLAPRSPRLEEWAYAGLVFNYTGAAASHVAAGDGAVALVGPLVFTGLAATSWALRSQNGRLALSRARTR